MQIHSPIVRFARQFVSRTARGRVLRGIFANAFTSAVIAFMQLLHIPILTQTWGVEQYGLWLMLTAIPTYMALGDFGVVAAATVEMTRRVNADDRKAALVTLQSTLAFMSVVLLAVALFSSGIAVAMLSQVEGLILGLTINQLAIATFAIIANGIVIVFTQTIKIVLRSTQRVATDSMHSGLSFLAEGLVIAGMALAGADLALVAVAYAATRFASFAVLVAMTCWFEPWAKIGVRHANRVHVRELLRPSIAALSLAVSGALTVQGSLLVVGALAGPSVVAVFGATRTLTRFPLQVVGFVVRPTLPELTRAQADGNQGMVRRLVRLNVAAALLVSLPFLVALSVLGPELLRLLSGGRLESIAWLFPLLSVAMTLNAVWTAAASPLIASNRHGLFAHWYLGFAVATILVAFVLPGDSVYLIAGSLCVAELLILCIVVYHLKATKQAV